MILHGVRSKSLTIGRQGHSKKADIYNQCKNMTESEGIREIVNLLPVIAAIQLWWCLETWIQDPKQPLGSHRDRGIKDQYLKSPHSTGGSGKVS